MTLHRWLDRPVEGCPCGGPHAISLRSVVLGEGVLDAVDAAFPSPSRLGGPLLFVADPDTWDAAGGRVARGARSAGHQVREAVLPRAPHADDVTIERLRGSLACAPARVVAVGSGTIGDLSKVIAEEAGVGLTTVGTAASMNGYASDIAALTVDGLKITRRVRGPETLVLDVGVLAAAPSRLTRAGFGDLMSKPVSGADWLLSHLLLGETLCPTALSMADDAVRRARDRAAEIGGGDPAAVGVLAESLVLSGLSMTVAGASSPASGGEHLLSHYLDISAEGWGRPSRLHGEQVAVGTLASLSLYARIREEGPPDPESACPPDEDHATLLELHRHLSRKALEGLLAEARSKVARSPDRAERRRRLRESWGTIWRRLDSQLAAGAGLARDLEIAGCPTTFEDIGVSKELAELLPKLARHMRDRYTVLDLAADLGL